MRLHSLWLLLRTGHTDALMSETSSPTDAQENFSRCADVAIRRINYSAEDVGRGLFATAILPFGTVIERCPVIVVPKAEFEEHGQHTVLNHYTFLTPSGDHLLALGYGSLFNHRDPPNVRYDVQRRTKDRSVDYCVVFTVCAASGVQPDEELCIYYGPKLWFDDGQRAEARPADPTESDPLAGFDI